MALTEKWLQRAVEYEEAQAYAEDNALLFMETSAKVGVYVITRSTNSCAIYPTISDIDECEWHLHGHRQASSDWTAVDRQHWHRRCQSIDRPTAEGHVLQVMLPSVHAIIHPFVYFVHFAISAVYELYALDVCVFADSPLAYLFYIPCFRRTNLPTKPRIRTLRIEKE